MNVRFFWPFQVLIGKVLWSQFFLQTPLLVYYESTVLIALMSIFQSTLSLQKTVVTSREFKGYFQTGLLYFYNTCFFITIMPKLRQ